MITGSRRLNLDLFTKVIGKDNHTCSYKLRNLAKSFDGYRLREKYFCRYGPLRKMSRWDLKNDVDTTVTFREIAIWKLKFHSNASTNLSIRQNICTSWKLSLVNAFFTVFIPFLCRLEYVDDSVDFSSRSVQYEYLFFTARK